MSGFENPFGPELFDFLNDLAAHNDRGWFERHRKRHEHDVKEPALAFISAFGPHLRAISPHFQAIPRAQGGSLFRIHRDTRFGADKTPYKTHAGLHFRHETAKSAHTPGFYLHLQPGASFAGVGLWQPDPPTLRRLRDAMVEDPESWIAARDAFEAHLPLEGERLKTAPRGYAADHPLIEDLRRKDFVGARTFSDDEVLAPDLPARFVETCRQGTPLVAWLCRTLDAEF